MAIDGETMETVTDFILGGSKNHCRWWYDQSRQHIKKQRHYFANKGPYSQSYDFSSSLVWMWELNYKENWVQKNLCFWTVVLEKTLESPLDSKESRSVHPKGNQSWIFTGRTDAEAEAPILWPPHLKRPWCWERLKAGAEGDDRRWDGWMASLTQRTWVWAGSGNLWWTGKPGVLQSMELWRVRHNLATNLNPSLRRRSVGQAGHQFFRNSRSYHFTILAPESSLPRVH